MMDASHKHLAVPWRFQFSIRSLMAMTAIVAVLMSIGVTIHRKREADRRPLRFIQAVQRGDLAETDRLLKIEPQLAHGRQHRGTSSSMTPLQMALVFGRNPKVVDRILQEKPDLDETSNDGRTALFLAVRSQMPSEVERLLQLGADANIADDEGMIALHVAAQMDHDGNMMKLLLEAGSDPNRALPSNLRHGGKSPLHLAAESNNAVAVMHLLDSGARVDSRDMDGRTPLHFAVSNDRRKVADLLLEHGGDLMAKDDGGHLPGQRRDGSNSEIAAVLWWERIVQLHEQGKIAMLDEILDAVPQVLSFQTEYSPATPLHRAVAGKRLGALDYLLGRGVDPNTRDVNGQTPLHLACYGYLPLDFARHLLDAGADIEAKDQAGQTPLHWAAQGHNHDVLQALITEGADLHALDNVGTTVLDSAFERTFHPSTGERTIELLRQAGHEPTVLYAAATGDIDLLQKMAHGDTKVLDRGYTRNGVRPLHAAVLGGRSSVVEWLIEQGVERDPAGTPPLDTPLMVALGYNKADIAVLLIRLGADVNRRGFHGYYPAHAVIEWNRSPEILEALLTHGADPTLKYQDKTALELAADSKSEYRDRYLELLDAFGKGH